MFLCDGVLLLLLYQSCTDLVLWNVFVVKQFVRNTVNVLGKIPLREKKYIENTMSALVQVTFVWSVLICVTFVLITQRRFFLFCQSGANICLCGMPPFLLLCSITVVQIQITSQLCLMVLCAFLELQVQELEKTGHIFIIFSGNIK